MAVKSGIFTFISLATFDAVRNLTHYLRQFSFDDSNHSQELLKNWILDFKLWSRSAFEVRVEHLQLVCSFLKDKDMKDEFRGDYGIKYFLNVIRRYYTSESTFTPHTEYQDTVKLTRKQNECLVGALMNIIKFYMRDSVDKDEFDVILSFLVAVRDTIQLEALLRKIHQLLSRAEGNGARQFAEFLVPHGHWLLVLLESDSPQVFVVTESLCTHGGDCPLNVVIYFTGKESRPQGDNGPPLLPMHPLLHPVPVRRQRKPERSAGSYVRAGAE